MKAAIVEPLGEIGETSALATLGDVLADADKEVRREAARALARLYRAGTPDEHAKQRVLVQREHMAQPHTDTPAGWNECGFPYPHTDRGIGVHL